MSEIKAIGSLSGKLSNIAGLSGSLSVFPKTNPYIGDYNVIPKAFESQILETANKLLSKNVVITSVPYFETSNDSYGLTAYIAKEV